MLLSAKRLWGKPKAPNVFQRMMSAAADSVGEDDAGADAATGWGKGRGRGGGGSGGRGGQGGGGGSSSGGKGGRGDVVGGGRGGKGGGKGGGNGSWHGGGARPLQPFKFVNGTPFVVDGFMDAPKDGRLYFLTHFHADHYGGLSKRWAAELVSRFYYYCVSICIFLYLYLSIYLFIYI